MRQQSFDRLRREARRIATAIRARPPGEDPHGRGLDADIETLGETGLLAAPLGSGAAMSGAGLPATLVLELLVELGGADLSLARLYEGHLNAVQLVGLYGSAAQKGRVATAVRAGALLGVWGADDPDRPLRMDEAGAGRFALSGAKRYASGVGLVRLALVPQNGADGLSRLLLLDVSDPARADASAWRMRGMRASRSGRYDFTGMEAGGDDILGAPGVYEREPYFVGGIWRCAAAQLGGIEAILALLAEGLMQSGRIDHPLQAARLGEAIMEARTARLWIEDAASRVEEERDVPLAVALSAFARLRTESAGLAVVALAERAIGLAAFSQSHPVERMARDLSTYLRQANPDAALLEHTRVLAADLRKLAR